METKKIKRGDRLQIALKELAVGESVIIPYRLYSENSIRATVCKMRKEDTASFRYEIDSRSNTAATITRTE